MYPFGVVCKHSFGILYFMTRLERKESELDKLYQYRQLAMQNNDFMWMQRNQEKIISLEKEIEELRKNESATVFSVLANKDSMVKNGVYKALLRISLLADATNEACEIAKSLLKEHGIVDFSFRHKVDELCKLSSEIACVTLRSKNEDMEDFIVDNETFVDMCIKHANAHIKRKLKI